MRQIASFRQGMSLQQNTFGRTDNFGFGGGFDNGDPLKWLRADVGRGNPEGEFGNGGVNGFAGGRFRNG